MSLSKKNLRQRSSEGNSQAERLLLALLSIPGKSGEEGPVVEYLKTQLLRAGADPETLSVDTANKKSMLGGDTGNLVLKLPGTIRGPRRLFVSHVDTVPICVGAQPVKSGARITSTKKHTGLGGDDRAGVAVLLDTARRLLKSQAEYPPLTFLWTVQEEAGLHGARLANLRALGKPQLAFNWDGGAAHRLTIGATGGYRMTIVIRGIASHAGGHPEQGVSAISIAGLAIAQLVRDGWHGLVEKKGQRGTSNLGVIEGGTATNVVADALRIRAEARSHEPAFRERIVAEIKQAFERATAEVPNCDGRRGHVTFEGRLDYEAFALSRDDPSVVAAAEAVRAVCGEVDFAIANGGLDANWLTARGIPTVSLGCGQNNIHTSAEWLDLEEFHRARQIAWKLATAS